MAKQGTTTRKPAKKADETAALAKRAQQDGDDLDFDNLAPALPEGSPEAAQNALALRRAEWALLVAEAKTIAASKIFGNKSARVVMATWG